MSETKEKSAVGSGIPATESRDDYKRIITQNYENIKI